MNSLLKIVCVLALVVQTLALRPSRMESIKKVDPKAIPTWKDIKQTRSSIQREFNKLKRYNPKYVAQLEKANDNKLMETPYFSLFMRPKSTGEWLPISEFTGDQRSTTIVKSWLSSSRDMLKNFFKRQIDRSVAASFFPQKNEIIKNVIDKYEPFKGKSPEDFDFGYKVSYFDSQLNTGEQDMTLITEEMTKGWVDEIKDSVTKLFEPKEDEPEDTSLGATYVLPTGKTEKESCLQIYGEDGCLKYKEKNGVFPWQEKATTQYIQNWIETSKVVDATEVEENEKPENEPWKRRTAKAKFNPASKLGKEIFLTKNARRTSPSFR